MGIAAAGEPGARARRVLDARHLDALLLLDDRMRDVVDTADLSFAACELLGEVLGAVRVGYGVFDATAGTVTIERDWSAPGVASVAGMHRYADYGTHFDDLKRGVPVRNDDVRADPRTAGAPEALLALGVHAFLDMPVVEKGCTVADMFVHAPSPRNWTDGEVAFLREFADRTRSAIARRGAEAALRASVERQRLLLELGDALREPADADDLSFAAASLLGRALGASRVGYAAIEHDAETLHVARDWCAPGVPSLTGTLALRDYGSFVDDLKQGSLIVVTDTRDDPRAGGAAAGALEAKHCRSLVNVPVVEGGRLVALFLVNHADVRAWTDDEVALIKEFADRTRIAVERAAGEARLRALNETLEQRVEERTAERCEADALYRAYFENTAEALFVIGVLEDGGFRIDDLNPAHQKGLGWSLDAVRGRRIDEVLPDDLAEVVQRHYREVVEKGGVLQYEEDFSIHGRSTYWSTVLVPVRGTDGRTERIIGSSRDLTGQRAAEAQLRQSQKMEAMGQLTGGVAHDFNNLLTPILGALDLLHRRGTGDAREQRLVGGALASAERAKTLVQRLLAFARRQPLQAAPVDLRTLVDGLGELIASTVGPATRLEIAVPDGIAPAIADANQLEMAILNLAVNARDAMAAGGDGAGGGTLTIAAADRHVEAGGPGGIAPGDYVELSVADTGTGMDAATAARAAEPFFSTKGVGKGTGLGLSMVHGLATQLGGTCTIDSAPGTGTRVSLWLPAGAHGAGRRAGVEGGVEAAAGDGQGTILLVEDEALVRQSTCDMLCELGYRVIEADCAEAALALLHGGEAIDLIVTDHLMPGMSGTELAGAARAARPGMPTLVISGYAESAGVSPDLPRLTKPFRVAELSASVHRLLGRAQQTGTPTP